MDVLNFRVFFKERIFLNKNTKITTDLRLDSQSEKHKPIKYLALLPYPMSYDFTYIVKTKHKKLLHSVQ